MSIADARTLTGLLSAPRLRPVISGALRNFSRRFNETLASTALVIVLGNIVKGNRSTLKSDTAVKAVAGCSSPKVAE